MSYYYGGLENWAGHGGQLVGVSAERAALAASVRAGTRQPRAASRRLPILDTASTRAVLLTWVGMVVGCALIYWLLGFWPGNGIIATGHDPTAGDVLTSLYFSLVTATSVGYGDVAPHGVSRALAGVEAAAGLLMFGLVVAKLVSRRQERLVEEIHHLSFENRLGRVQTDLHLVISEIQELEQACLNAPADHSRLQKRAESAALVFIGDLLTVHDLLYQPDSVPDQQLLESTLAGMASALDELAQLRAYLPRDDAEGDDAALLDAHLRRIARLADEICDECIPAHHAATLLPYTSRIQAGAQALVR